MSASTDEREHDSESNDDTSDISQRRESHSAAAAGPSSTVAALSSSDRSKGRAVAVKDAASLLPANLDEEMLKTAYLQLRPRHRMQKQALLQSYREQFSHWRFLLRYWLGQLDKEPVPDAISSA